MKQKFTILLLIVCFSCFSALAQNKTPGTDSSFVLVKTYTGDIADAVMDNLDNLYLISSTGQIRKYNANGDSVAIYSQARNFGKLFSIDVTNPLQPLLFYKDYSTVVLLDRFLANRTSIDLRKYNILQPGAVGISYDNNIWVYDEWDNKLKKVNESGNLLLSTVDFRTAFNEPVRPQKIIDNNTLVYLADTATGVFVNYGTYKKKIAAKNWQSIAVKDNYIISTNATSIGVYNTQTFMDTRRMLPGYFEPALRSFSTATRFVNFSNASLYIYTYRF